MLSKNILTLFRLHWIVLLLAFIAIIITGTSQQVTQQRNQIATKEKKNASTITLTPTKSETDTTLPIATTENDKAAETQLSQQIEINTGGPSIGADTADDIIIKIDATPTPTPHIEVSNPPFTTLNEEQLIDQWIAKNNLNEYGDPFDTMYIGGTPLFNEATGEYTNRYDYVRSSHPDSPWR